MLKLLMWDLGNLVLTISEHQLFSAYQERRCITVTKVNLHAFEC